MRTANPQEGGPFGDGGQVDASHIGLRAPAHAVRAATAARFECQLFAGFLLGKVIPKKKNH